MSPGLRAFAASLTLNAFCSASLGQPTFLRVDTSDIDAVVNVEVDAADLDPSPEARALRTFKQLYKFAQILSTASESRQSTKPKPAPEDLTRRLSPEFSFCNSIFVVPTTGSTPRASGFFLHIVYLATLSQLVSDYRSSILSSLQDVLERCLLQLGAHEAPPIVVGLVGMVLKSRCAIDIEPAQSARWVQLLEALKMVWTQQQSYAAYGQAAARVASNAGRGVVTSGGGGNGADAIGSPLSMSDGNSQGLDNLLWSYFAGTSPGDAALLDSSFSAQLGGAGMQMDALGSPEMMGLDGAGMDDDFL